MFNDENGKKYRQKITYENRQSRSEAIRPFYILNFEHVQSFKMASAVCERLDTSVNQLKNELKMSNKRTCSFFRRIH